MLRLWMGHQMLVNRRMHEMGLVNRGLRILELGHIGLVNSRMHMIRGVGWEMQLARLHVARCCMVWWRG